MKDSLKISNLLYSIMPDLEISQLDRFLHANASAGKFAIDSSYSVIRFNT